MAVKIGETTEKQLFDTVNRIDTTSTEAYGLANEGVNSAREAQNLASSNTLRLNALEPSVNTKVSFSASQSLTAAQKTTARNNIGAGTSNFSGSYLSLTNLPNLAKIKLNGTEKFSLNFNLVGSNLTITLE